MTEQELIEYGKEYEREQQATHRSEHLEHFEQDRCKSTHREERQLELSLVGVGMGYFDEPLPGEHLPF